ncbi:tyrosine-type recombinase/integrase [Nocardia sp. NPDC050793]|uniref:site-specific integrase n=1 Tax=Nocardia sp. NPDC050793 TaxID=3155159 RepID=UPI0033E06835
MDTAARLSGRDLAALRACRPAALPGVLRDEFRLYLAGRSFAESTQVTYHKRARGYLKWLVATESHPEALSDGPERDAAVAEYLAGERPSTRKVTLAAIRALYEWFDLGPVSVDPEKVDPVVPATLSEDEQSRVLDAAAARSARDYALVTLMLDVGPSTSEVRGLDDEDVNLSARAGSVVLTGSDGRRRTLALTQATTWVLMGYRRERRALLGRKSRVRAFFVTLSSHGRLRDDESLGYILAEIGDAAGLGWKLTASALRATAELRLYRSGLSASEVRARMGQGFHNGPRVRALLGQPAPPRRGSTRRPKGSGAQLSFDIDV